MSDRRGPEAPNWDWHTWISDGGIQYANVPELRRLVLKALSEARFPHAVVAPLTKLVVPPKDPSEYHRNLVTLSLPPRVIHNIRYGDSKKDLNAYALVEVDRTTARAMEAGLVLV